jgi:hypothetical protein
MSLEMAHKVIVPQKKIMSRIFLNSGTLIVKSNRKTVEIMVFLTFLLDDGRNQIWILEAQKHRYRSGSTILLQMGYLY